MKHRIFFAAALLVLLSIFPAKADSTDAWTEDYISIEKSIRQPVFPSRSTDITRYGARPDASPRVNRDAINRAIADVSKKGGGRVVVPAGHYYTGPISLQSGVNLVVSKGAVIEFVFEPELYPIVKTRWEGIDCHNLQPCIYAYGAKDIAVTGEGTIDGGGSNDTWWKWCGAAKYGWKEGTVSQRNGARARLLRMAEDGVKADERRFGPEDGLRPQLINFHSCNGILIEDVTLLRSPFWVIHPLLSENVTVRRVKINNNGPNGDGCDPESCKGVLIEDCFFNTGDDCIAIKSGRNADGRLWNRPSENIIVRNCEMKNGHGGVVIGSEISGGCRNVFVENNLMDSPNLDRVIRIKTNTCRGGVIENVYVRNVEVGQCRESVLKINLDYERNEICCRNFVPKVRNINLDSVTCGRSMYGVQIIALDKSVCVSDINVSNCRFDNVAKGNYISGKTRDINFDNLYVNGSLAIAKAPYKNYSEWMTRSEMKRVPKSYLLDFSKKPKWSYVMGIELESMLDTYLAHGGDDILDYCKMYTDSVISADGRITGYRLEDYNLDQVRTGHFVARMHELFPTEKTGAAIHTLIEQMSAQPRTAEGVFWHKAIYAWQVWLDGIFMGLPFSVQTADDFLEPSKASAVYDDAADQVIKTYQRTLDKATGLNRHAWDETREMFWADSITGLSKHCWGRAQGWFTMALVEILDRLPQNHPRRQEVIDILKKNLDAVVKWQDPLSGVWYQVMDSPGREGNYLEATCSSMFAYSLLKAYRKGYVGAKYRDAGLKAYRGILDRFIKVNPDTTISLTGCCSVAGLGPGVSDKVKAAAPKVKENRRRDGSFEYYIKEKVRDNDAKGIGPFIWASLEMERLGYDCNNVKMPIDRVALVSRHNPVLTAVDTLASLTVSNGNFAVTVDATGMQTFAAEYKNGIPLTTMSEWGWHSFPNTEKLEHGETLRQMDLGHGHKEVYAVEYKDGSRNQKATQYYRVNPHRVNLGLVGLDIKDKDGRQITAAGLTGIRQELKLYDGEIESSFDAGGNHYDIITACMPGRDCVFYRLKSKAFAAGYASVALRFPYPTGLHADDAADWSDSAPHTSKVTAQGDNYAVIERNMDSTHYYTIVRWEGKASFAASGKNSFTLKPHDDVIGLAIEYTPALDKDNTASFEFDQSHKAVMKHWQKFWREGAAVDFSACSDPRAAELERRVVLSQYLTAINASGKMPPQETGLTYNSWFGRPHLEMAWWHTVDHSLWGRADITRRFLDWYMAKAFEPAKAIAARQGFGGARWMKMTDPDAGEAPSNTGSFLIWQQPHFIYLAEEVLRNDPSALDRYAEAVEATAQFMADYAKACDKGKGDIRLFGQTAMQESMSKDFSYCHPFEQAYWKYGLAKAQEWRQRRGLGRNSEWDEVIRRLASPVVGSDGTYVSGLPLKPFDKKAHGKAFDPYVSASMKGSAKISKESFDLKSRSDHPAVLGVAMLPDTCVYDAETMRKTMRRVLADWNFATTWGWDYGMIAMAAARLGCADVAVDALLVDTQKNTYLPNGHNYQDKRLRLYMPGNGSLLAAVAMMCAGWDGCSKVNNPGFPDGWNVRWEGLHRMQ